MIRKPPPVKNHGEINPHVEEDLYDELRKKGRVRVEPRSKSQKKRIQEEHYYERD